MIAKRLGHGYAVRVTATFRDGTRGMDSPSRVEERCIFFNRAELELR